MAIEITKTLQTVEYVDLYFKTSTVYAATGLVVLDLKGYKDSGHYTDGFLPLLQKTQVITDAEATASFNSAIYVNPATAIADIEAWMVANVAYYSGGAVV